MRIEKLDNTYFQEVFSLYKEIENNLENPLWLSPCKQEWLQSMLSAENRKALYGMFSDNNEIMAIQGMSPTIKKIIELLTLNEQETIEIGSAVVLPKFRGNSLTFKLASELIKKARLIGYTYVVSKAHPDNIVSNKILLDLGMQLKTTITTQENVRNVYLLIL